ncbi:extracellular solute-binding protein [Microvirga sp. HBU67558]|uniref:ABC transporter substrate-binding protein n=1 Tax=Microvirga TaxID=186650 RepID=UPI001B374A2D|nr:MULTISPECIES: extracellular solute-binding protein [unclassified Microvirga]MBQ0820689.1 extracellular solute-binding protein [Microvirga sp. HBU67558]
MNYSISRRTFVTGMGAMGLAATGVRAQGLGPMPSSPVALNVIDVAGNLALSQKSIDAYKQLNPKAVSRITYTKAPAPELASKLKAQQSAGRVDIDIVLTGTDALFAGIEQQLFQELLPQFSGVLPKPEDIFDGGALKMQALAKGYGLEIAYSPSGPLFEYRPDRVKNVPKTAEDLLAYTRENKGRFLYARPANSGPGRTFLMGLPYLLKDQDPTDPQKGWDKTWAYLKALGENIEYYPSGTGQTMKEIGDGSRDMIVSTVGWYINPRALGIVPKEVGLFALEGFHWVSDAQYFAVPKGVAPEKMPVVIDLLKHMLKPEQQAYFYDEGYFYPGPSVKAATLAMAPKESQDVIKEYGWPDYDRLIGSAPVELQLQPEQLVVAFRRWDEEVGGAKRK